MNKYEQIRKLLYKFEKYGVEVTENGTILIGHPDYLPEHWRLVMIFQKLETEEIDILENECGTSIPHSYKNFLTNFSNGLDFINDTLSLYGLRKIAGRTLESARQPYALKTPNKDERWCMENVKDSYFFIGSYKWDGSHIYIDKKTEKVHLCAPDDATPLFTWNSLEDMLISELTRLYSLFTEDGHRINKAKSTLPI